MGYALFTARKLSVNTRLNSCNANLTALTERENVLTQSIFAKQQASTLKANKANLDALTAYSQAMEAAGEDSTAQTNAKIALDKKMAEIEKQSTMDETEIFGLNQQQSVIDLEKKSLETQLKAFQNELESVQKAEESAIKNSTPKF